MTFKIPLNPTPSSNPQSTPLGSIGILLNGVPLYNQYAGQNYQPLTFEVNSFDHYYGHPQMSGQYHYHSGWVESQGILFLDGTPYSGWQFATEETGDTIYLGGYVEGLKPGIYKLKYPGGTLIELRRFIDGRQNGPGRQCYVNGRLAFEADYSQDHYEGLDQSWYEKGQQHERFHYQNGREDGRQQRWNEQGNVIANYEARNGRKYGLSGTKHCVSSWELDSLYIPDSLLGNGGM